MAIAQLIFGKKNIIGEIELDIIISESASTSVRVTENPVENGANMNDHIIVDPSSFTTTGVVSNISSSTTGQVSSAITSVTQDTTKAQEAWNKLLELQVSKEPFTLVQGLKKYENVVILTLTQETNKETANGLFFTATMKEIILVGAVPDTSDQFGDQDTADKTVPATQGGLK